jgi:hypothetical protein
VKFFSGQFSYFSLGFEVILVHSVENVTTDLGVVIVQKYDFIQHCS